MKKAKAEKQFVIKIAGLFLFLGILLLLIAGHFAWGNKKRQQNHEQIQNYIQQELTYSKDNLENEKKKLLDWCNQKYVSDADKGILYERAALTAKFQGDTIFYYKYIGYALYYLKKANVINTQANIYADLATLYISDFAFDNAQEMLDNVYQLCDIEELEDQQVKSYVYRLQGRLDEVKGDYACAERCLTRSLEIIEAMDDSTNWKFSYKAITDVCLASVYFEEGKIEEAQAISDTYEDSEWFRAEAYADILARDFSLPYYEVTCRLDIVNQDYEKLKQDVDSLGEYCEKFGYEKRELHTFLYMLGNLPENESKDIYNQIEELYWKVTQQQSLNYSMMISNQVQYAINERNEIEIELKNRQIRIRRIIILSLFFIGVFIILNVLAVSILTDGLTKVYNRKALNGRLRYLERTQKDYAAIMLDIDNFKKLNDTYGHSEGDKVLQVLGHELKLNTTNKVKAYRYGGEEFTVLLLGAEKTTAQVVAEKIRSEIEALKWSESYQVTVSMGVADSRQTDDVMKLADENLYKSKQHGKNCVTLV